MDSSSTIETTGHSSCALKVVVIGNLLGIINVLSSLKDSKRYICESVVIENCYGVNFRKYLSHFRFKEKPKLLLRSAIIRHSLRKNYKDILSEIRVYYNSSDIHAGLFELVPQKVLDDTDVFLIVCNDNSSLREEYKTSDYAASLIRRGVSKDKIFVVPDMIIQCKEISVIENEELAPFCKKLSEVRPILRYVEYHVTDFCNLKCKGCTHIANKVNKIEFASADNFRLSLKKLKEKFSNIAILRIMGGEPLLCKELHEYIDAAHEVFPYSQIKIVTNGLLYRNITHRTIESIRNACAEVQVTQYPPTRKILNEIIAFSEENGINISVGPLIEKFWKLKFTNENYNYKRSWLSCDNRYCHLLHGTTLFACPFLWTKTEPMFRDILGEEAITDNDRTGFSYDFSKEINDDGWDILMKLENPIKECRTCGEKIFFKWESEAGIE